MSDLYVHYRPDGALPKQIKQRPATLADLVAALRDHEGVEEGSIDGGAVIDEDTTEVYVSMPREAAATVVRLSGRPVSGCPPGFGG